MSIADVSQKIAVLSGATRRLRLIEAAKFCSDHHILTFNAFPRSAVGDSTSQCAAMHRCSMLGSEGECTAAQ